MPAQNEGHLRPERAPARPFVANGTQAGAAWGRPAPGSVSCSNCKGRWWPERLGGQAAWPGSAGCGGRWWSTAKRAYSSQKRGLCCQQRYQHLGLRRNPESPAKESLPQRLAFSVALGTGPRALPRVLGLCRSDALGQTGSAGPGVPTFSAVKTGSCSLFVHLCRHRLKGACR